MFRISVITAAFRKSGLQQVLVDLAMQEYKEFDHIIVNDGQPDIREFMKTRKKEDNEHFIDLPYRTGGFGGFARNIGIMAATKTIFVTFFDDDNRWKSDHLKIMAEEAEAYPEANLIAVDAEIRGKKNKDYRHIRKCVFAPQNIDLGQVLYKKELFWKYGFFYPRPEHRITYDYEILERMKNEPMRIIGKATFVFAHRRR